MDDDAQRSIAALRRLTGAFTAMGHAFGRQHGLSPSEVAALVVVTEADAEGAPVGPVELSRRIGMTAPSATVLVDRLVTAHLVERRPHETDRRRVVLRPTDLAQAAGAAHFGAMNRCLLAAIAEHAPTDVRVVAEVLIHAAAAADRLVQVSG